MKSNTLIPFLTAMAILILNGCAQKPPAEKTVAPPAPSSSTEDMVLEAQVLASNASYDRAAGLLEEALKKDSNNVEALKLLARVYAAMGRRKSSSETWSKVFHLKPDDPEAAYEVGVSLARKERWRELRSRMLEFTKIGKADGRHFLLIGEADMELGYRKEAKKYLIMAGDIERAVFLLGKLYYSEGKLEKAEKTFLRVLRINPDHFGSHLHLGWLYYKKGLKTRALNHYRDAVRMDPASTIARLSLAKLLQELGKEEEAIVQFKKALGNRKNPSEEKKKAYITLCNLLLKKGKTDEVVYYVNKGLGEFPDSGGLYYMWAMALLKRGNRNEAIAKLRIAARDPRWSEVSSRQIRKLMR